MSETTLLILLVALVLDWFFGEPEILWSRLPHPVVLFGKAVVFVDRRFNRDDDTASSRYRKGSVAIAFLIGLALATGLVFDRLITILGTAGFVIELFIVFALLAQRSLHDHVRAVANGLADGGVEGGREAVGLIVGRDPAYLDKPGICRAAIESLAENFSDGVVAPAFWYAVFGLPGLLIYKMINTADSMIGYKSERYLWFGRSAAIIDDWANWLPARFSALLIAMGAGTIHGIRRISESLRSAFRHAGLHASPNAGWPEAAMAGAARLALGGSRTYAHGTVQQAWINPAGERQLSQTEIDAALGIFSRACFCLWAAVALLLVLVA